MNGSADIILKILGSALLVEFYAFLALKYAFKGVQTKYRKLITALYWLATLGSWVFMGWLRYFADYNFPKNVKAILLAMLFGIVVGKMVAATIMLLGDLLRAGRWLLKKLATPSAINIKADEDVIKISRSKFIAQTAVLAGGLMFGGLVWGTTNRYRYQLKHIKLKIAGLPDALKGLKIAHISDIHSGSFDNKEAVRRGVELLMQQTPDLIVFTGDLVNDRSSELEPYLDVFGSLSAPLGVYATLGNHDYGDYVKWPSEEAKRENLEQLMAYEQQMGWRLLMNEHVVLEHNGASFALIGVENWSENPRFPRLGDLQAAYKGLEGRDVPLKILLSHDPSHWDAQVLPEYKDIQLTLSGHTHGMQFGIELPWMKWSPSQYVYRQWAGLYAQSAQHLYVNRGFGFLGYQGRLGILPEVTIIELA
ncbi:MAG TPA: metallophosphoesterase [Edaphocola sp.]|nr:metallophosphoesterase [Edaphocola sp.]